MMKTLFVSDFDRTLYVNREISRENLSALEDWKRRGNLFVIATGREENILRELLGKYHLTADYLICNNGAEVVDWEGRVLFERTMEEHTVCRIVEELLREYHTAVDVTQKSGRIQVKDREEPEHSYKNVFQLHVRFEDTDRTRAAAERLNLRYEGAEAFANEWNLDIVHRGIDKAGGIEALLKIINWKGKVAVIGDSFNDLCMIERFGGYTLAAADKEVQKKAVSVCRDVAECIKRIEERI